MFDNAKYYIRMIFPVWGHLIRNAFSKFIAITNNSIFIELEYSRERRGAEQMRLLKQSWTRLKKV